MVGLSWRLAAGGWRLAARVKSVSFTPKTQFGKKTTKKVYGL
jgi:hypothetical protein